MRISDWSSDVCSSDLPCRPARRSSALGGAGRARRRPEQGWQLPTNRAVPRSRSRIRDRGRADLRLCARSEEHTSELQSLMRISYAVFCLKKKTYTDLNLLN